MSRLPRPTPIGWLLIAVLPVVIAAALITGAVALWGAAALVLALVAAGISAGVAPGTRRRYGDRPPPGTGPRRRRF